MAHIWTLDPSHGWRPDDLPSSHELLPGLHVVSAGGSWVLVGTGDRRVRVNGQTATTGLVVLNDRDEIVVAGQKPAYFSSEQLAKIESFPGGPEGGCCPRCRQSLDPGIDAVRCPSCSLWYHASVDRPCWEYSPTCAVCPQQTALDAGFRWTPEEIHPWRA